ncbi:MAG: glycosyltransferase family 2 protein [Glaciihabitans sp.]|nr:glycosyltransferase family 2 protein [Glaciihabitans sp.]
MASISVVIPAYNDARFLGVALHALANQTRPFDELIVVDNGSTDATAAVAREAGAALLYQPLRGIFPASAMGFDAASGEIIARLDADSVPPADWLERVEATLMGSSALSAVTGPGDFYGAGAFTCWAGRRLYIGGFFWFVTRLLGHSPVFGSNFAMRRGVWDRVRHVVHSELREVHDDLDLSIHFDPQITVIYDATLRVGISARPFQTLPGIARRIRWAFGTLALNWREGSLRLRLAPQHHGEPEEQVASP